MRTKEQYYSIDYTLSPQENLKKLVNQNFQREISFDVLRNKPPDYSNLYINLIKFEFLGSRRYELYSYDKDTDEILYLTLSTQLHRGRKNRYGRMTPAYKRRSNKVNKGKIDLTQLRRNFDELKALKEIDVTEHQAQEKAREERNALVQEVRNKYNVGGQTDTGIYIQNPKEDGTKVFQLSFNHVTEDQVRILMSYYQQIK